MKAAPLRTEIADAPPDGAAWWLHAADGVRLRVGLWQPKPARGTVLLFPGRTEYVEKYGRAAGDLARRGFATFVIDWRGQGLADRLTTDKMAGHVARFADYQRDVAAMVAAAKALDLPRPWHLLAHSMGGCIGLRAVLEGLPVAACAFSGPMWGIRLSPLKRPLAWSLSWGGARLGLGHAYAPGTVRDSYVLSEPFDSNQLTRCPDMYRYMIDQVEQEPSFRLAGPSLSWVHEALRETRALARRASPRQPCLTIAGTDEEIVDTARIHDRMARWPGGTLDTVPGARHEVLMDLAEVRGPAFDRICALFGNEPAATAPPPLKRRAPPAGAGARDLKFPAPSRRPRPGTA